MKRSTFIKYVIPSAWALQACVKEEAENPPKSQEPKVDVTILFPETNDFLIAGALNPIRFTVTPQQEVEVQLLNLKQDDILATAKGTNEVWLQIPKTKEQTTYVVKVHKTVIEINSNPVNGEPVSVKQYQQQFIEGKTIAYTNTNNIPFALKQLSTNTYIALDMTCTHNGCPIELLTGNSFECGCHGSTFDADGKVTKGPALDPLRVFSHQYFPAHQIVVVQNT